MDTGVNYTKKINFFLSSQLLTSYTVHKPAEAGQIYEVNITSDDYLYERTGRYMKMKPS